MSVLLFLILIILFLIFWPAIKVGVAMHRARKQARDFFNGTFGGGYPPHDNPHGNPQAQRSRRGKKIDPDVGEYVEFEEISVYQSEQTVESQNVEFATEEQVEDAVWEEVK